MIFFIDSFDNSVEVFRDVQQVAKHILAKLGVSLELGMDPVKQAQQSLGNRGKVLGIAGVFEMISQTEDKKAQELALKCKEAVDRIRR